MTELLELGRESYAAGDWAAAQDALSASDGGEPLEPEDLLLLARAAYMLGRDDEYIGSLERAHHAYLEAGRSPQAALCAFWVGHNLIFRGETAPAHGWFARAERLLEGAGDCVERGYVLIAALLEHVFGGEFEAAQETATEITVIGSRFDDSDLVAIGLMEQGHALVRQGRVAQGLRLVDETMVSVTTGELSPIVAGLVYCNTIAFCRDVYELRRAREWTAALTRWCDQQPDMVAHKGLCLVHRAELMQFGGDWRDASKRRAASARSSRKASSTSGRSAMRPTGRARCTGCAATSMRRSPPTAKPAGSAASRSPGSRSCGWRAATSRQRPPRFAGP